MRGYVKVPPEDVLDDDGYFDTGDLGWLEKAACSTGPAGSPV